MNHIEILIRMARLGLRLRTNRTGGCGLAIRASCFDTTSGPALLPSRVNVNQYSYSNSRAGALWGETPGLGLPLARNGDGEDWSQGNTRAEAGRPASPMACALVSHSSAYSAISRSIPSRFTRAASARGILTRRIVLFSLDIFNRFETTGS